MNVRSSLVLAGYAMAALAVLFAAVLSASTGMFGDSGGVVFAVLLAAPGLMLAFLVWLHSTGRHIFLIFLIGTALTAVGQFLIAGTVLFGGGNAWGAVYALVLALTGVALAYFTIMAFRARRTVRA